MIRTTLVGLVRHFALELDLLKTNPSDVDVDDELLPELVDNPGNNKRYEVVRFAHNCVIPSLVNRGF